MNTQSSVPPAAGPPASADAVAKRIRQVVAQFVIIVAILLAASGRPRCVWLWLYIAALLAVLAVNARVVPRELAAERGQPGENVKPWDKTLAAVAALMSLAVLVVAGLNERFGWPPLLSAGIHVFGLASLVLGQLLFTWAMVSNPFFSTAVRLQMDRGHTVATQGPYRFVRHPGYVGYILFTLATAPALGSLWALIPGVLTTALLVVRTALEDRTLRQELPGYAEYAQRVRYRLLPGVW